VTHPSPSTGSGWSGAVAAWCALWLVVGVWTGHELWQLGDLGGAVADTGRSLSSAGEALQSIGSTPLVGRRTGELGVEISSRSADIVAEAESARGSLRQLAVLLGLAVALVPTVPAVVLLGVSRRLTSSRRQEPLASVS